MGTDGVLRIFEYKNSQHRLVGREMKQKLTLVRLWRKENKGLFCLPRRVTGYKVMEWRVFFIALWA